MTESQLHAACFRFWNNNYPNLRGALFHVQQAARNAIQGNQHKALGVYAGVADFVAITPTGQFLAIELKTETGTQSPAQKKWQSTVQRLGGLYYICRTLPEFQHILSTHYGSPTTTS